MKKGAAIDIAIVIGAIVIPTAALLGSLIFAFSIIGNLVDAVSMGSVVSHDVVALSGVAYSIPDEIDIYYKPPPRCEFVGSGKVAQLTCFDGEVNMTNMHLTNFEKPTRTYRSNNEMFPYGLLARFTLKVPEKNVEFEYKGHANLKDTAVQERIVSLKTEDGRLVISKQRNAIYDTLGTQNEFPIYTLVRGMYDACVKEEDQTGNFKLPPLYYICTTDEEDKILLKKHVVEPVNVSKKSESGKQEVLFEYNLRVLNDLFEDKCDFSFYKNATTDTTTEVKESYNFKCSIIYVYELMDYSDCEEPECDLWDGFNMKKDSLKYEYTIENNGGDVQLSMKRVVEE